MRASLLCGVLGLSLAGATGCIIQGGNNGGGGLPDTCTTEPQYVIDTGASITHAAGIDAGYYVEYDGSGAWHIEWTCDTKLSAEGCTFSGAITAPTPAGGIAATCFQCEADDQMTTVARGASTEIDFTTDTSSGIDGVDFVTTPGAAIDVDLYINGIYQTDLVFLPSGGVTSVPACMPASLVPSAP